MICDTNVRVGSFLFRYSVPPKAICCFDFVLPNPIGDVGSKYFQNANIHVSWACPEIISDNSAPHGTKN